MIVAIAAAASSAVRSSWRASFSSSGGNTCASQVQEVAQEVPAFVGQHRLGMELHAVHRLARVAQAHDRVVVLRCAR